MSRVRTSLAFGSFGGACAASPPEQTRLSASKDRVFFMSGSLFERVYSSVHFRMDHPQKSTGFRDTFRTIGGLGTVGLSFVFAIFIGAGIGYYLMTRFG